MTVPGFIAYGTLIRTALPLGSFLPQGEEGRYRLDVAMAAKGERLALTGQSTAFGSSHGRELTLRTDRPLGPSTGGQRWCFEVGGVARFHWTGAATSLVIERLENGQDELLAFWLIHIFLPLYFTLENRYQVLHACSVEVGKSTILFTGPSHGGKSTLIDHFLQRGHTLVSDDKVATFEEGGCPIVVPSHPNHRPYRKYEDLGLRVQDWSPAERRIAAIYALHAAEPRDRVQIEEFEGHRKFVQVLPSYLYDLGFEPESRLRYLARMLESVPVCGVQVPWDLSRLPEVHDAICRDLQGRSVEGG